MRWVPILSMARPFAAVFWAVALTVALAFPAAAGKAPFPGTSPSTSGTLLEPRAAHTATLLPDGRVLVVGGLRNLRWDPESWLASAELWDPATGTSSPAGSMAESRSYHTATLLQDGRVLIVGGGSQSAEVWDPVTLSFSPAGSLPYVVMDHTATLLTDGRVLVVGLPNAQIWDPATGIFSQGGPLRSSRSDHTATSLPNGRVLILGGETAVAKAEVWDPAVGSFKQTRPLITGRWAHTATLLRDGRVLVTGGITATYSPNRIVEETQASAELRDARTGVFVPAGSLARPRHDHTATLLEDGRVLVLGGQGPGRPRSATEIWDPATRTFSRGTRLVTGRIEHTATLLRDGRVLVIGGVGREGGRKVVLASTELWGLVSNSAPPSSVSPTEESRPVPGPSPGE